MEWPAAEICEAGIAEGAIGRAQEWLSAEAAFTGGEDGGEGVREEVQRAPEERVERAC